jgi:CheY-like chemotaxis protein
MKKNILLVDDDEIFNFVNQKALQHAGVASEIHIALSGRQGLDLLNSYLIGNRSLPDVILLDLNMPVMDGFTFLEAFQRIKMPGNKPISIIIVTSSSDPRDKERAKSFGIKTFLTKPISQQDIIDALSQN